MTLYRGSPMFRVFTSHPRNEHANCFGFEHSDELSSHDSLWLTLQPLKNMLYKFESIFSTSLHFKLNVKLPFCTQ